MSKLKESERRSGFEKFLMALLRMSVGFIFLWAFLDKLWGLERSTPSGEGWVNGFSPTENFLMSGVQNSPFVDFFQSLSGQVWVDWLFMIGLASIGVSLILGICMRLASVSGALISILIFIALYPPANEPFISFHIIYFLVFLFLGVTPSGNWFGLGRKWRQNRLVKKLPFLK